MKIPEDIVCLICEEQIRQNGNFFPGEDYLQKLSDKAECIVYYSPSGISGFVFFYCNDEKNFSSYISLLMVTCAERKKGVGAALIRSVLNFTKQKRFNYCRLEVRKENIAAIGLYKSMGFRSIEDRSDKYLMEATAS
ncbi:GNAT family N-acetyltransferase [Polaromonas sp.]|uniref:GNAT family N-acetyltransferase n=1 Tax=Polaromonas sp. TaxID=1869339 RepID=UPI0013BBBCAC|nr:GNAT family N-acetyltransferase [Polaromonas sp.]NDP61896.1 GNAT family N-acetyltransferase [Polaromonas sp.]